MPITIQPMTLIIVGEDPDEEEPIVIPVSLTPSTLKLVDMQSLGATYKLGPAPELTRPIDIRLSFEKTGNAVDKVTVSLINDVVTLPIGGTVQTTVTVEPNMKLLSADQVNVILKGEEM
jgi:hypothetical protein